MPAGCRRYRHLCVRVEPLLAPPPHPVQPVDPAFDVKATVEGVLDSLDRRESRASKLDIDDFLALLDAMNRAGIHFVA
jgi:hypothetical protein